MHTGTQPAREAANMIDLDSNPTKLIDIVETGKQLLMTRGSLTTFSIANDVSKYLRLSRRLRGHFTGPESVERNASGHAGKRRIIRRDIQCADYHGAGAAGIARCALPGGRRSAAVKG